MIKILKSFLEIRYQFTEIQNIQSKIVIQGLKLSGWLYMVYTNKIPRLHLLMNDENG